MHRFTLEHRISHADVDLLGELKVQALLGLCEQAAVEASADAGLDPAWYTREGRVWIIRRTHLERSLPVGGGDTVVVETHVADWRRARSLRRYEVRLARPGRGIRTRGSGLVPAAPTPAPGALVARATTDWVYCDLTSGRPVSIPEQVRRAFSGDRAERLPRERSLPDAGGGAAAETRLTVGPSHLDHVTHVNNAAYAGFLEDGAFDLFAAHGLGVGKMLALGGALRVCTIDLEYLVDAVAGDELVVRSWLASSEDLGNPAGHEPHGAPSLESRGPTGVPRAARLLQAIDRSDGTRLVRAASDWVWRVRPPILGGAPES